MSYVHWRRGDLWSKWLVQLVVCLHWFNPMAYLLKRELSRLSELACDEALIRDMDAAERRAYGQMLLDTLRASSDLGGPMIAVLGTKEVAPGKAARNYGQGKHHEKKRRGDGCAGYMYPRYSRFGGRLPDRLHGCRPCDPGENGTGIGRGSKRDHIKQCRTEPIGVKCFD